MDSGFFRQVIKRISTDLPSFSFINFLTLVLTVLLFTRIHTLYSTIDVAPKHINESYWMHGAYFYYLFFLERDFFNKDWRNLISYDHPPVSRYILGFALHVVNHKVVDTSGGLMDWHRVVTNGFFTRPLSRLVDMHGFADDRRLLEYSYFILGHIGPVEATLLSPGDYMVGRMTVFFFAVLATALLVAIGSYAFKRPFIGVLAGLVFLSNDLTIPTFQQVLSDSICCFFVLLALLILLQLFRELGLRGSSQKKGYRTFGFRGPFFIACIGH